MEIELNIPVLLIAFNRPDTTTQVFNRIRAAKPHKLYIAVDGGRQGKEDENNLVDEVRAIVKNVDWPCETYYHFNEENLGAEITVSSSINWVFEKEEYAIILEDDIMAPVAFFRFAQEMLLKYKNEEKIGIISGNNFTPIPTKDNADYFFAKYAHSWGWATWKRTWEKFDLNIEVKGEHLSKAFLRKISNSKAEARFYKARYRVMQKRGKGNNTWDSAANYISRVNGFINIIPRVNLTSNIGVYGLHAKGRTEHHFKNFDEEFVVKNHPYEIDYFKEYDVVHFRKHIYKKRPLCKRILNKIYRFLHNENYFKY